MLESENFFVVFNIRPSLGHMPSINRATNQNWGFPVGLKWEIYISQDVSSIV
jgi:hypothetical protein